MLLIIFFIIATANFCLGIAIVAFLARPPQATAPRSWSIPRIPKLRAPRLRMPKLPRLRRKSAAAVAPAPVTLAAAELAPIEPVKTIDGRLEQTVRLAVEQLAGYRRSLAAIDDKLRQAAGPEQQPLPGWLIELRLVNADYLERQRVVSGRLHDRGAGPLSRIRADLEAALARFAERMQTAAADIDQLESHAAGSDQRAELVNAVVALFDNTHELRDHLTLALIEIARRESRLRAAEPELLTDALTELPSRAQLELQLDDWWQLDPERTRKLSVAALDIDGFRQLNQQHGATVCDAILRNIAEIVAETNAERRGNLAGVFAGQRLALLLENTGARNATGTIERVRQTIQLTTLRHGDREIQLTVTCGVVEAQPDDTADSLFQRVEATLQEAKRYGRNRTFLHEGTYPTPVMPLAFELEPRVVASD